EAERLAGHEVDQAFSQSLRQASLDRPKLSRKALELQQRITELEKMIKSDEAHITSLSASGTTTAVASNAGELEVAKAQLGLDQNELNDLREELARETGDQRVKLQQELRTRQAAMKQYNDSVSKGAGQNAVASAEQYKTLAQQLATWRSLKNRKELVAQAEQLAKADIAALTDDQARLRAEPASDSEKTARESSSDRIDRLQQMAVRQNVQTILNDRLETQQQLAALYGRWGEQVAIQRKDCRAPHIASRGFNCSHLFADDRSRLGPAIRIGKDGSRSSADIEHGSASRNTSRRAPACPAGNLR